MRAMLQDTPPVHQAYEEYIRFKADPIMREKVKARERFLDEQQLLLGGAFAKGETKGRTEGRIETARNLKRLGIPAVTIAEATGLSSSEIERLS